MHRSLVLSRSFASGASALRITVPSAIAIHRPASMPATALAEPSTTVTTSRDELFTFLRTMSLIRRVEIVSDQQYKARMIRGFCHLYSGEEAICTGMEAALDQSRDAMITAYRDHGNHIVRGGSAEEVFAELFGRATGMSKGKGGSMHFYNAKKLFFGGNGIVGAQCPVGAGLAFGAQRLGTGGVSVSCYGDGAANQGQIFEAMNMAALWKLPAIFVCENNQYGMGTSTRRGSADDNYYSRGHYIPGIKVDGMNVLAVKEATRVAREYAVNHGPIVMEMSTYRYSGHSMSDPGVSYRTRDEVQKVREERDPIERLKGIMLEAKAATEADLEAVEKEIKIQVDEALAKALAAPEPEPSQLTADIYVGKYEGTIRMVEKS
ncbi:mitochondrial pyruvate dehydrogenase (PDH) E1 alpha [Andalucia godoyi]|uniref:Pyruvate dehydrogenase E1 component subunit alpha n=1 Tax=Andalucia godoyi TaxID=505711 RepID=A0A8K0AHX2_ANDGO|nr:mitochondrial pyruvate dehydrogenase (PDH) E1 alpha [Andalucia godoyi]|eukprot:ANDGO_00581.mRNA.1 mitochondrial pyruvate dehydrogenase (PDH) E1 alpha